MPLNRIVNKIYKELKRVRGKILRVVNDDDARQCGRRNDFGGSAEFLTFVPGATDFYDLQTVLECNAVRVSQQSRLPYSRVPTDKRRAPFPEGTLPKIFR